MLIQFSKERQAANPSIHRLLTPTLRGTRSSGQFAKKREWVSFTCISAELAIQCALFERFPLASLHALMSIDPSGTGVPTNKPVAGLTILMLRAEQLSVPGPNWTPISMLLKRQLSNVQFVVGQPESAAVKTPQSHAGSLVLSCPVNELLLACMLLHPKNKLVAELAVRDPKWLLVIHPVSTNINASEFTEQLNLAIRDI